MNEKNDNRNVSKSRSRILVLCTGNSCRSQMAEGWIRELAGDSVEVYSAGVETHGVNQNAVRVMGEAGVDISAHTSNHVDEYRDIDFDLVLTVCDHARERCPVFPGATRSVHQNFRDPAKFEGQEEKVLGEFRSVRDEIKQYVKELLDKLNT